jgi:hypothetical protein
VSLRSFFNSASIEGIETFLATKYMQFSFYTRAFSIFLVAKCMFSDKGIAWETDGTFKT